MNADIKTPITAKDKIQLVLSGNYLPVMEEFYSLQGEGFHTGKAAYFIRIGGCDIGCHWCDVKESWNADIHPVKEINEIIHNVLASRTHTVVITGGEPSQYNLIPLTQILKKNNIAIHIETSGTHELKGHFDWICVSPKKQQLPLEKNLSAAHELKIIIYNQHDFIFAEKMRQHVSQHCHLFLQPEWSKKDQLLPDIISFIQTHTHWRLSLQTHKYIHIP